jgi:hypothetical protein
MHGANAAPAWVMVAFVLSLNRGGVERPTRRQERPNECKANAGAPMHPRFLSGDGLGRF